MMELTDSEKETSEILRSLLTVSRVQNQQVTDVNCWQQSNCIFPAQEQIVWQIDPTDVNKRQITTDNRNIIQHIPVTYLTTTDNRNISFATAKTIEKPITYVLGHNVIAEAPKNNETEKIIINEPQKIVFIQEIDKVDQANAIYNEVDFSGNDEHQVIIKCKPDYQIVDIENNDTNNNSNNQNVDVIESGSQENPKEVKRKLENERKVKVKKKKVEEEEKIEAKSKVKGKKKVDKKNINKKKKINSKLKNKFKKAGKPVIKKPKKQEISDGEENKKEEASNFKGNHNELTKLEDNAEQVAERFRIGCECSEWNCFDGLNPEKVFKHRLNIADLTKAEHDMYLMGVIMASMQNPDETCRHKERVRIRSSYAYQGKKVCLTAFLYLEHVTLYQMKRLRKHLKYHGVSPRIHGNHGRKPANTLSLDIYQHATNFVQNYIEKHSVKSVPNFTTFSSNKIGNTFISGTNLNLHDPSKPGKKPKKIKIANKMTSYHLPPECTKKTVHDEYKSYCEGLKPDQKVMQYSTFTSFLKKQFPNVKFHKIEKKSEEKSDGRPPPAQVDDENGKQKKKQKKIIELFENKSQQMKSVQGVQNVQTQVHNKTVQISPPPLIVAQKAQNPQNFYGKNQIMKTSQIVLNGAHVQFCGGTGQLQSQNQVLAGNQIISAHCVSQAPTYAQHVYTMHNINDN